MFSQIPAEILSHQPTKQKIKSVETKKARNNSNFNILINTNRSVRNKSTEEKIEMIKQLNRFAETFVSKMRDGSILKPTPRQTPPFPPKLKEELVKWKPEVGNINSLLHGHMIASFDGSTYIDSTKAHELLKQFGFNGKITLKVFNDYRQVLEKYIDKGNELPAPPPLVRQTAYEAPTEKLVPIMFKSEKIR